MNKKIAFLYFLGYVAAILIAFQSWSFYQGSKEGYEIASTSLNKCRQFARQIEQAKSNDSMSAKIQPATYEPGKDILQIAQNAKINIGSVSKSTLRNSKIENTDFAQVSIQPSIADEMTMKQVCELLIAFSNSDSRFQARGIELTAKSKARPTSHEGISDTEKWSAKIDVYYWEDASEADSP